MKNLFNSSVFLVLISLIFGCSQEAAKRQPADKDMRNSFKVVGNQRTTNLFSNLKYKKSSLLKVDREQLAIHSSALEKEFLLHAHLTEQSTLPLGQALKSRVVFFRKKGEKIYLLESSFGHRVTERLPHNLLLAEFDILRQENGYITLDFNKGMSHIFVASEFFVSDYSGAGYKPSFQAVGVELSYLDQVSLSGERVEIKQIAQLKTPNNRGSSDLSSVAVKYYLSSYQPSSNFIPRSGSKGSFGYFEVAPFLREGREELYSMRFNENKKTVFALSSNTPNDFKDAVKEGILYWNKVLGKDILEVIDAPEGVTAPNMDYNVVQWLDLDYAGFAYADVQADPRTGEVLHAQVYFSSSFAVGGKKMARDLLASLPPNNIKKKPSWEFSLKGFETNHRCMYDVTARFRRSMTELLSTGAENAMILKVAQDYVREVAAHEVGHTLGLRHNFAGSHGVSYKLSEREGIFNQYLRSGKTPKGVVPTSSVMEYSHFFESAMTGDLIKNGHVMSYDEKAIKHLYLGHDYSPSSVPAFCTDSQVGAVGETVYIDCQRFDFDGREPAQTAVIRVNEVMETFALKIFQNVTMFVQMGYPIEFLTTLIDPAYYASVVINAQKTALDTLTTHSAFVNVRKDYGLPSVFAEDIRRRELNWVKKDFDAAGGVLNVLKPVDTELSQKLFNQFRKILSSKQGERLAYMLAGSGQKEKLLGVVKNYFEVFQQKMVVYDLVAFGQQERMVFSGDRFISSPVQFSDHDLGDLVAETMFERVLRYGFSEKQRNNIISNKNESQRWDVPEYIYDFSIRKKVMSLLAAKRGEAIDWGWEQRQEFDLKKEEHMKSVLASNPENLLSLPKALRRWVLEWRELDID